jgi:hypothetical protein
MTEPTELCLIAERYGTDKCPAIGHSYTPFYHQLFGVRRKDILKVVEFGIGGARMVEKVANYRPGASLRMWRDYFPFAQIYGVDNDPACLFSDNRISTFLCDEHDLARVRALIEQLGAHAIDLVIDDASHRYWDQVALAATVRPLLRRDAVYVIEDVHWTRRIADALPGFGCVSPALEGRRPEIRSNKLMLVEAI